ncbi:MAG: PhoU domain-containing protein [Thermoleophilia bacterium]
MAIRQQFQTEIESLRAGMVEMASVVLNQVERSVAAWHAVDAEAARAVIDGDERVDERCAELDQKIFNIQLLEAPVAGDQRLLHVGLIAVIALERVGDLAVAIANLTLAQRADGADPDVRALIQRMSARAVDTLAVAVQAIARGDVPLGERATEQAAGVRRMLDEVLDAVAGSGDSASREWGGAAILVARHLERVANNGAELGGRVRFLVTGEPFSRRAGTRSAETPSA